MNTTAENNGSQSPVEKKKHWPWITLFLLLLIFTVGGGSAYYLYQKQQPEDTVIAFLNDMKKMDFQGMASHLQSSDLSALDNADIRNDAYSDFFHQINSKLSFKIKKNHFDFQNGTANVTVLIKYIDGSEIYQEAISEFLRQIVSAAFSGEDVHDAKKAAEERLAFILSEKASTVEDKFTETELTYPLIREDQNWKIVALNEETVQVMSANFKNAADEVHKTLNTSTEETLPEEGESSASETDASLNADDNSILCLTTNKYSILYTGHTIERDFAGKDCLLIYYDYTNTSSTPSSAMVDVSVQAFQGDVALTAAIPEKNNEAVNCFFDEIKPGETVNICQAFSLENSDDVVVEAQSISEKATHMTSQIIKLK